MYVMHGATKCLNSTANKITGDSNMQQIQHLCAIRIMSGDKSMVSCTSL